MKQLTPKEKEAMDFLPGYRFVFRGECVEVKRKWTHSAFLSQHRMIPFLEDIVPHLQNCHWEKDRPPIAVTETEKTVIVIVPAWPPSPTGHDALGWCGADYFYKFIYDKSTGERIWARRGG